MDKEKPSPIKTVICALVIEAVMSSSQTCFKVAGECGSTRVGVGSAQVEKFPGTAALMRMNRRFRLFYLSSYGNVLRKMEAPGSLLFDMPFVQALALNPYAPRQNL